MSRTRVIKAPNNDIFIKTKYRRKSVFLAGSIEMGKAEDWQQKLTEELVNNPPTTTYDLDIFNPRRDGWDASWVQDISNEQFRNQVQWELSALKLADVIALRLCEGTQSPISLLEFGLYADSGKLVVFCDPGFWRNGNIQVVCNMYNIPLSTDWNTWVTAVRNAIQMAK